MRDKNASLFDVSQIKGFPIANEMISCKD